MNINKHIVIATIGITGIGIFKKTQGQAGQVTKVLVGGFVLMLSLSVLDLAGGQASKLASSIAMLALVASILTSLDLITKLAHPGKSQ